MQSPIVSAHRAHRMYLFLMIAFSFTERKATPHAAWLKPWRHYARINSVIFSQNRFAQDEVRAEVWLRQAAHPCHRHGAALPQKTCGESAASSPSLSAKIHREALIKPSRFNFGFNQHFLGRENEHGLLCSKTAQTDGNLSAARRTRDTQRFLLFRQAVSAYPRPCRFSQMARLRATSSGSSVRSG